MIKFVFFLQNMNKMCKNKNQNGNGSWDNTHQWWLVSGRQ